MPLLTTRRQVSKRLSSYHHHVIVEESAGPFVANNRTLEFSKSLLAKRLLPKVTVDNQHSWIVSKVNPFIELPYEEQLRWKFRVHREILLDLSSVIPGGNTGRNLLPCVYSGVLPSPVTYGYRNKDNFTVGRGVDGSTRTIGQTVGQASRQDVFTVSTAMLVSSPVKHKVTLKVLQDFVNTLPTPSSFTGTRFFWQDGFVRSNKVGDVSLSLCLSPRYLSRSDAESAMDECKKYFSSGPGAVLALHSLHVKMSTSCHGQEPFNLVLGRDYLVERLLGHTFHISPDSFFQVNPAGAEVLYNVVRRFAVDSFGKTFPNKTWTLLDVCCGTGTIGILMADLFDRVIGFDAAVSAIENARKNALRNGITNAYYLTGSAKSCLKYLLSKKLIDPNGSREEDEKGILAVVNPGRSGLSDTVMRELRGVTSIRRIIYVSCNPGGRCLNNFYLLCRPERFTPSDDDGGVSRAPLLGKPFLPVQATSVDMFPHTDHCEMVIVFDR